MRILFIGDIVGEPGRRAVRELVPVLIDKEELDFVIANGENVAGGSGVTPTLADELLKSGVDVITSGDHIWKRKEILEYIETSRQLLRPANYPRQDPGRGSTVIQSRSGIDVGVINLIGRVFMEAVECPFRTVKEEIEKIKNKARVIIVDMHAEATSEKVALVWYLDGIVSDVVGTHTHIQTADAKILPQGTAFMSDVGMTGPYDSVIGRKKEQILTRFLTQMPARFEMAEGDIQLHGAILDIDDKTGRANSIQGIQKKLIS
jgi:metallophosphoesterase (TIGR00282 family)